MHRDRRGIGSAALGALLTAASGGFASSLSLQSEPDSIYAPPAMIEPGEGINQGGVRFGVDLSYFTDFVYRGIEQFEVPRSEDRLNLQIDTRLEFDFGKLPHPYVNVFVNVAEADPISDFQIVRPEVGFDWLIKPVTLSAGYISYIYPERSDVETSEFFLKLKLDDSFLFRRPTPTLSPYVMAAYDFDLYDALYLEAGVEHRFNFEDTGLSLTLQACVAYVNGYEGLYSRTVDSDGSGFQHYQLGVVGEYSLNQLFNISTRYGDWSLMGYAYWTDELDRNLRADRQIWGGGGISFRY